MEHSRKVTAISRIPASEAHSIIRTGVGEAAAGGALEWEKLAVKVPAELTISSKTEDKQPIFTAKLTFTFCGQRYDRGRYIYKVKLANGRSLLIGTGERPYPVCETSEEHPSSSSSNELTEVVVTYSSPVEIAYI